MNKVFTYSVLQHHYSSFVDEVINIGVLFFFSEEKVIEFQVGNLNRIKCLYENVDISALSLITNSIKNKINKQRESLHSLFGSKIVHEDLNSSILRPDDSSIQFTSPKNSPYPFPDIYKIIEQYSGLLLPNYRTLSNEYKMCLMGNACSCYCFCYLCNTYL